VRICYGATQKLSSASQWLIIQNALQQLKCRRGDVRQWCVVVYTVYRLEQLAPRPKCVISRHQVCLSVCLSVRLSFSVRFLCPWYSWARADVLEYSIKSGSVNERSHERRQWPSASLRFRRLKHSLDRVSSGQIQAECSLSRERYFVVTRLVLKSLTVVEDEFGSDTLAVWQKTTLKMFEFFFVVLSM